MLYIVNRDGFRNYLLVDVKINQIGMILVGVVLVIFQNHSPVVFFIFKN